MVEITIAIPTYKRPQYLVEALESAIKQIEFENYEIIIVDNDSEREFDIENLVNNYKKKYFTKKIYYYCNEKNLGMVGNWNACIEKAQGEYITILNDDDKLYEDYLKNIGQLLKKNRDAALFFNIDILKKNKIIERKINGIEKKRIYPFDLFIGYPIASTLGILYKKKNLLNIGGFKEKYYPNIDSYMLFEYTLKYGGVYWRKKKSGIYRIYGENTTREKVEEILERDFILREIINRKCYNNNFILKRISEYLYINQKKYLEYTWNNKIKEKKGKYLYTLEKQVYKIFLGFYRRYIR